MTLSDLFWTAANEQLAPARVTEAFCDPSRKFEFCCHALALADSLPYYRCPDYIKDFMRSCGLYDMRGSGFDEFERGEQAQGVRYMFLLFCSLAAEDDE